MWEKRWMSIKPMGRKGKEKEIVDLKMHALIRWHTLFILSEYKWMRSETAETMSNHLKERKNLVVYISECDPSIDKYKRK